MQEKSVNATSYTEKRLEDVREAIRQMGRGAISGLAARTMVDKTTLARFVNGRQDISASKFLKIEFELNKIQQNDETSN